LAGPGGHKFGCLSGAEFVTRGTLYLLNSSTHHQTNEIPAFLASSGFEREEPLARVRGGCHPPVDGGYPATIGSERKPSKRLGRSTNPVSRRQVNNHHFLHLPARALFAPDLLDCGPRGPDILKSTPIGGSPGAGLFPAPRRRGGSQVERDRVGETGKRREKIRAPHIHPVKCRLLLTILAL
jgi:hypothetical protein